MKINIIEKERPICKSANGIHTYFAWPSVARLQDGSLMAVASGFRITHVCPFGKVIACRSYDEGKSWTAPEIVLDTPLDDRDGGICTFGEKGVVIASFNNTPDFQRKNVTVMPAYVNAYLDQVEKIGGWEKYNGSTLVFSNDGGKTFGAPVIVPISSPHGPCELNDGTLFYVGRLFHDVNSVSHIECHTLTPDGRSELRSRIEDIAPDLLSCEPHAIQLPNGRIVVHIRVQRAGAPDGRGHVFTIYQSVSDDNGYTFSKPVQLLDDCGGSPAHLIRHSSGALISVYGHRRVPFGIKAMFSYDNGNTWDIDNVICDGAFSADSGYPASVELENGDILTVYYGREFAEGSSVLKQVVWNFEKE